MIFLEKLDFLMERYGLNKSTLSQKAKFHILLLMVGIKRI